MNARTLPLGVMPNLPIEVYHASAGISNSGLADFARSPAHYYALHLDPHRPEPVEKDGQLEGNLAHCAILEPTAFNKRYAAGPNVSRATKEWKAFVGSLPSDDDTSLQPIKDAQAAVAWRQAKSVRALPDVAALLAKGQPEVSAFWIDPATGELCRCRPDWVHPVGDDAVILVDVKTVSDASPREFAKQVDRKRYARQAVWYSDGYAIATGKRVLGFAFVPVEMQWPYAAAAYMLPEPWLESARAEIAQLLPRFAECRQTNKWPGYSSEMQLLEMPRWLE